MRILFLIRNHGYLRNYDSTLRLLAERGHQVVLASRGAERHMAVDTDAFLERLSRKHRIKVRRLPKRGDEWTAFAQAARSLRNYVRYLEPLYRRAHKLRSRGAAHALRRGVVRLPSGRLEAGVAGWAAALFERALPNDPIIERKVLRLAPDVLLVTPLVDFNSYQVDYVKAAQAAGIPTVWCVASWDNLSNKGVAPIVPDRVLVWNETQRQEAVEMHRIPPDHVVLTGAQLFDIWFELKPSTTRQEFCERVGLPDGPFLLYLCSSLFIAPDEVAYVRDWLERLRAAPDPVLRRCGVLIRPHPGHAGPWTTASFDGLGPVVVWPRQGEMPLLDDAKRHYFDSLFHCAAVVGVNTSGMIEAAIVGRRSFTMLAPEFADTQAGTVHFEYLTSYGFLTPARSWEEHMEHLAAAVAGRANFDEATRARALTFVRPDGIDDASTPRVVAAIEAAVHARRPPPRAPRSRPMLLRLARIALFPWVRLGPQRRPAAVKSTAMS